MIIEDVQTEILMCTAKIVFWHGPGDEVCDIDDYQPSKGGWWGEREQKEAGHRS